MGNMANRRVQGPAHPSIRVDRKAGEPSIVRNSCSFRGAHSFLLNIKVKC